MQGDSAVLQADLTQAIQDANLRNPLKCGGPADLYRSYRNLCLTNTRLIFLTQGPGFDEAIKYESYEAKQSSYQTQDVGTILKALGTMTLVGQYGSHFTVLQVQGTATGKSSVEVGKDSFLSLSEASSPLMATKGRFDNRTYPWLMANVASKLSPTQLVVFLNDFADNTLADHARAITAMRVRGRQTPAFVVSADGRLYYNAKAGNGGTWSSSWAALPVPLAPGVKSTSVRAAYSSHGGLEVFAVVGDGTL